MTDLIIHNDWAVHNELCSVCRKYAVNTMYGTIGTSEKKICLACLRKLGVQIYDLFGGN